VKITHPLTVYRRLGAVLFEEAVRATGLTPGAMALRLRAELARPTLTAPTLRAWRRGNKAVPLAAFLAVCRIAGVRPATIVEKVTAQASQDADAELLQLLKELEAAKSLAEVL